MDQAAPDAAPAQAPSRAQESQDLKALLSAVKGQLVAGTDDALLKAIEAKLKGPPEVQPRTCLVQADKLRKKVQAEKDAIQKTISDLQEQLSDAQDKLKGIEERASEAQALYQQALQKLNLEAGGHGAAGGAPAAAERGGGSEAQASVHFPAPALMQLQALQRDLALGPDGGLPGAKEAYVAYKASAAENQQLPLTFGEWTARVVASRLQGALAAALPAPRPAPPGGAATAPAARAPRTRSAGPQAGRQRSSSRSPLRSAPQPEAGGESLDSSL